VDGPDVDGQASPISSPVSGPGLVNPPWWPARSTCPAWTGPLVKPVCLLYNAPGRGEKLNLRAEEFESV